ncbi:thiamine pyrophosphate-binding protein [Rhizorhabdus dicambivorans]|uniref:Thiamine pyrophosphate-binding protein n=2 Tax=Rhizorhabdus dicambivorans TaxID=1850238 RepID=A0A2A4FXU3_9SPHN|nr:thiamine pyrophosphate-binding protein [Rhizorhabdus dicambivorans]PCE42550.1 thiamine pyrophosphate-binding protein [Rhizorhabdus dicambivorans]
MSELLSGARDSQALPTGGHFLVEMLRRQGVTRIFTVPGESFLPVLDALVDVPEIEIITCRNEGGAAMMAEAHGKLTGEPGICFVTRGPGATNASCGVHVAAQDSTPMILFIGQVDRQAMGREAFQEIEFREMFRPLAKWVAQIDEGDRLAELLGRAFATATSGRRGPVVLALPEDMLAEPVKRQPALRYQPSEPGVDAADADRLLQLLAKARRPLLLLGGGGWDVGACDDVRSFAERWKIPVAVSFRCQGLMDNAHPCYVGDLGIGPGPALVEEVEASDLLIILGARLGEVTTAGYKLIDIPEPRQPIVHIHPSAEELGRVYRPALAIQAGVRSMARSLAAMEPEGIRSSIPCEALRAAYLAWTEVPAIPGHVQMGDIMRWLRDRLPADSIITNGAGNYASWPNRYYRYRGLGTMLAPTCGSMGYGLPAAIAAKLHHPERAVIAFAGDGCLMMSMQEIATAVKYRAAVIILIVNNGMLGTIRLHQERDFPGRVIATDLAGPDFAAIARGFGAHGETVRSTEEFAPAFGRAIACGGPALIDIIVDPDALTPTMTLTAWRAVAEERLASIGM